MTTNELLYQRILEIIKNNFVNGLRANSIISNNRIRHEYESQYDGEQIPKDFDIDEIIVNNGIAYEDKFYFIDDEGLQKLIELVNSSFHNNQVIYYSMFYDKHTFIFIIRFLFFYQKLYFSLTSFFI